MPIIRIEKPNRFTVISNLLLEDENLSAQAKGVLCYMLSRPDDWVFSVRGLTRCFRNGKQSISSILSELEENGYLTRERERLPNGQLGNYTYTVYEHPRKADQKQEQPKPEKPAQASPVQENRAVLKTDQQMNNIQIDAIESADEYRQLIRKHIDYRRISHYLDIYRVDELIEIMVDAFVSADSTIRIGRTKLPRSLVIERLNRIDAAHIEYVIRSFEKNKRKVSNIKSFLLTSLYNAPTTLEHYNYIRSD